jgi:hypothetical protein
MCTDQSRKAGCPHLEPSVVSGGVVKGTINYSLWFDKRETSYRPASEGVYPDCQGWRAAALAPAVPVAYDRVYDSHGLPLAEGTHDGGTGEQSNPR